MILNAFAVLDGFTTLLRLVLALSVIGLALRGRPTPSLTQTIEDVGPEIGALIAGR